MRREKYNSENVVEVKNMNSNNKSYKKYAIRSIYRLNMHISVVCFLSGGKYTVMWRDGWRRKDKQPYIVNIGR